MFLTDWCIANKISGKANPVLNWFESEKQKTIEYQTKAWTKTKEDFSDLVKKFGLLGEKKDESHD